MIPSPPRPRRLAPGVSLLVALVCTGAGHNPARSMEPESIEWREDYGSALEEARAGNRFLWIQFTGPWCPNCTRMERDSFVQPAIIQHARQSFVPLKLRCDVHEQLALSFNLAAIPATIIVAPNRDVIAIHQGYLGPAEFDAFLRDCLAQGPEKLPRTSSATGPTASPAAAGIRHPEPRNETPLALSGYCVVSLICDRKLVPGQTNFTVRHEGRIYRFATLVMSDRFRKEPERYLPVNDGSCPVNQVERGIAKPGNPRWGVLYQDHLFLCATAEDRRIFVKNPELYAMVDVADQGFCVHCRRESGLLVRGDPRHEVARQGRRYWFPDSRHRDAFLSSLR
ncbi:MAG: thioredoxin family protein [Isosphaerales bacterium]